MLIRRGAVGWPAALYIGAPTDGTRWLALRFHPGTERRRYERTKIAVLGTVALLSFPSYAVEPDVDSPAGPQLPAPRTDRPDFQEDDQPGALLDPEAEGADPSPLTSLSLSRNRQSPNKGT